MYDKRKFNKINDKKVLHKVKKQWVTISLALLIMIGGGAVASHVVHASIATNSPVAQVAPTNNIQNNANNLHKALLTNAVNSNKTTNNRNSMGNNVITNNKESSSNSASVAKSSASNNLMSFSSADFDWNSNSSDLNSINVNNSSLTSLSNKATSYNNEFNSVSSSVSDIINNINNSVSDINQSISDKLANANISSAQAKSMSHSVYASASSVEASEQRISSSVESEYNNTISAKNNTYISLCKSLDSSNYSNYLNLVNDRHINPTFKDASIISSGINYSPAEKQYILNIHNQLSDLNKQSDQLDSLLRKDNISDISMFNENGGPVVSNKDLITNHPDALNAYRNLEINWVNFYRKIYNLPQVHESSRLDAVAQQYAEKGMDLDCLSSSLEGPNDDISGYYTDADNADHNGMAGHRSAILNYEPEMGVGANNGKNGKSDDTLLDGDYAGWYIKNYDYLKPYRNGEIGMNYAISYPKPGLFSYSDAKSAQQWSLWVPTLHYSSEADAINSKYQPLNGSDSYLTYLGKDTNVTVHDDTTNQNVNVSNITLASDYGDADYLCYVVDNNAIQLNHTYTITVSNIHNWQSHTFKYTTKLYDPNMSFSNSNNNSASNQNSSSATSASSQSSNQSSVTSQNSSISSNITPNSGVNSSARSKSNNQGSVASQNNHISSSVAPSSTANSSASSQSSNQSSVTSQNNSNNSVANQSSNSSSSTAPNSTANSSVRPKSNSQGSVVSQNSSINSSVTAGSVQQPMDNTNNTPTSVVTPTQNNTTLMSDNNNSNNSSVLPSSEPQTTNTNSQVSDSTKQTVEKHHNTRIAHNHHAKRKSIYLFNTDFKGLSKRNRSVVTIKSVRAYRRTRKGHYVSIMNVKPNTKLAVKRVIKFGKITKLQLTNGWLVTANKYLVTINKGAKRTNKRGIKGINTSRYTQALRKSNYVLRHGRRHATRYAYRMAKKFNKANKAEKKAYRKFTRKHTNRNRKAYFKVQTNLNNLVSDLLK